MGVDIMEQMKFIRRLPEPMEMKQEIPLKPEYAELKERRDKELADIMTGKDDRFLLIIGPCSADNETAVLDYCERLAKAADEVKDKLFIVPRVYTNKPRTIGKGYKGMLHQPGGEIPQPGQKKGTAIFCCPDVETINVFKIERIDEEKED